MRCLILILTAWPMLVQADVFVLKPTSGRLVYPPPWCGNEALRRRVQKFVDRMPVVTVDGATMALAESASSPTFEPIIVIEVDRRRIGRWRAGHDKYTVVVSIEPRTGKAYLGIVEQATRCGERWDGTAERLP